MFNQYNNGCGRSSLDHISNEVIRVVIQKEIDKALAHFNVNNLELIHKINWSLLGDDTTFYDLEMRPLCNGRVFTYKAGTNELLDSYSDYSWEVKNGNPILLDEFGKANVHLKGIYDLHVFDSNNELVEVKKDVINGFAAEEIINARRDLKDFEDFMSKPSNYVVERRKSTPLKTLDYHVDELVSLVDTSSNLISNLTSQTIKTVNDAINNTAVEGGVLADTFVTVTANGVGAVARTQRDVNNDSVNAKDYGVLGDGSGATVQQWYTVGAANYRGFADLAAVTVIYPHVTSSSDSIDYATLQQALNTKREVVVNEGHYILTGELKAYNTLIGFDAILDNSSVADGDHGNGIIEYNKVKTRGKIKVTGFKFKSGYVKPPFGDFNIGVLEWGHHIRLTESYNISIYGNEFDSPIGDAICIESGWGLPCRNIRVRDNKILNPRRCGIAVVSGKNVVIEKNDIQHNAYVAAIDLEPNDGSLDEVSDVVIEYNLINSENYAVLLYDPRLNKTMSNITINHNTLTSLYGVRVMGAGNQENLYVTKNILNDLPEHVDARGMAITPTVYGKLVITGNIDTAKGGGWYIEINNDVDADISDNTIKRPHIPVTPAALYNGMMLLGGKKVRVHKNTIHMVDNTDVNPRGILLSGGSYDIQYNDIVSFYGIDSATALTDTFIDNNRFDCALAGWAGAVGTVSDVRFGDDNELVGNTKLVYLASQLKQLTTRDNWGTNKRVIYGYGVEVISTSDLQYDKGSIMYNTETNRGSYVGWVCTTAGNGATSVWTPFGFISNDTSKIKTGTTSERPDDVSVGFQYFDTTLGKPLYLKSAGVWVDSTGTTV